MDNIELVNIPEKPLEDVYQGKYTKAVQLTKKSRFRIVNKFLLWYKEHKNRKEASAIRKEINTLKDKEDEYSKSKYMIEQGSLERVQRKIKILENRLDILDREMKGISAERVELIERPKPLRLTFRNLKEVRNSFYVAAALANPLKKIWSRKKDENQMEVDINKDVFSRSQEVSPQIAIPNIPGVDEDSKESSSKMSEDERLSNLLKQHMAPVEERIQTEINKRNISIQKEKEQEKVKQNSADKNDELERIPVFTPYEKQIYSEDDQVIDTTGKFVDAEEEFDLSDPVNSVNDSYVVDTNKDTIKLDEILRSTEFQSLQRSDNLTSVTNFGNDQETAVVTLPMHDTDRLELEKDINALISRNQQSTVVSLPDHSVMGSVMEDDSAKLVLEKAKQQLLELEGRKRDQQEKLNEARRMKEAAMQSESQATRDKEEALQFKEEAVKEKNQSLQSAEEASKRRDAMFKMFAEHASKLQKEINDGMKMEAEENKLAEVANKRAEENRAVAEAAIKEGQENKAVSEANNRKAQQDMEVSKALEEMLGMSNVEFSKGSTGKHL